MNQPYIEDVSRIPSPALLFFEEIIRRNAAAAIELAGGAERLWPHVKTHKCPRIVDLMMEMGIHRFKCATLTEARMLAQCGAPYILLAYPLVGPNIGRFVELQAEFPASVFFAIGDDESQINALSEASQKVNRRTNLLLDLDLGMHRTGVPLDSAEALYRYCAAMPGLALAGLHGYDGHIRLRELSERADAASPAVEAAERIRASVQADGLPCDILVLGGTPTFPVHARREGTYLSPGTSFLMDTGDMAYPDLPFTPAAYVLTRVVSHPIPGRFTLDLGTKGIASEMSGPRGQIIGWPQAQAAIHSEEHWAFDVPQGDDVPPIGQALLVIPAHICPTCALYDAAWVVRGGKVADRWEIVRGRE